MLIRLGRERLFVEDIARAAHVSIGALYRHFPSRELLLEALTGYLLQQGRDNFAYVLSLSSESCTTLAERVQRIVDMTIASARFAPEVAKAVVTSRYDFRDGEDDETVLFTRRHLDLFTGWLLGCRDEIIHPSPEQAARVAICTGIHALQTEILFVQGRLGIDLGQVGNEIARMMLGYLNPQLLLDAPSIVGAIRINDVQAVLQRPPRNEPPLFDAVPLRPGDEGAAGELETILDPLDAR